MRKMACRKSKFVFKFRSELQLSPYFCCFSTRKMSSTKLVRVECCRNCLVQSWINPNSIQSQRNADMKNITTVQCTAYKYYGIMNLFIRAVHDGKGSADLAARCVHCDFRKSKHWAQALDVGIKQYNTHYAYASTALYVPCTRFCGVRGCGSTVRECVQCTACIYCTAHCILLHTALVTGLKIQPITRILGEYSLEP